MTNTSDAIRIIFFADTHLGFDYPIRPKIVRRRRGEDFFNNYEAVLAYAAESKADFVIHGGDLFFRSRVPQKIIDLAYGPLLEFTRHDIPFLIVPGNHERSLLPDSLYLNHPNIHIFDVPKTFSFDIAGAKITMSGFPFERNDIKSRLASVMQQTGWRDDGAGIRLLCIHQAVEGARVGPSNFTFRHGHDVVQIDDVPEKLTAVLSGHIHRRQILYKSRNDGRDDLPIIFPGSTERTSFAEKKEEKGFFEISFSPAGGNRWDIAGCDFRPLPARPMEDLYISSEVPSYKIESYMLAKIKKLDQNAIVRLRCKGTVKSEIRSKLTSGFLRGVFPKTMNFQLGSEFY